MPTRPLADVLQECAPLDATAQRLLTGAQMEAEHRAQAIDVSHVMFAVALNPWSIHDVHDSPAIRALLTNPRAMDELRGALRALVNSQLGDTPHRSRPSMPLFGVSAYVPNCTEALQRCFATARTLWSGTPLNDAMLVWAILNDDNPARHAVVGIVEDLSEPTFEAIVSDLERRVARDVPSHHSMSNPTIDHSRWMPEQVVPHQTLQYVLRHRDLMLDISDAIQAREHRQFVLVSGLNGSPLHHVPQILADAIGEGAIRFGDLMSVWWADAVDYLNWADPPITVGADVLLQEGIEYVKAQGGVLVLEHLEALAETSQLLRTPLQQHLLGQLRSVPGAAIVALYEAHLGANPTAAMSALGLGAEEARLVSIDPYSSEYALSSLHDNFLPAWKQQGFIFEDEKNVTNKTSGPYRDILALVAGARVYGKPMALPYLLVDVTEHLFTRREELGAIKKWAQTTEERVNGLLAQSPPTQSAAMLQHYQPLLAEALQQAQPLKVNPGMEQRGSLCVITRRHLTATFLGSALSRFAYPNAL